MGLEGKDREQVRAKMRKVPRAEGGEWVMPTNESVAVERELTAQKQPPRERAVQKTEGDQPKDQGGPNTMATKTKKATKVIKKANNKKATRRATAPNRKRGKRGPLAVSKNGDFRGTPGLIVDYLIARGAKGATEPEVREKTCPQWTRCTWTMKKTITAANKRGYKGSWKDEDGGTRYFLAKK